MSLSTLPTRPKIITPSKTYVYKRVGNIELRVDVYVPSTSEAKLLSVVVHFPGGGWVSVNRTDYSSAIFYEFLSHNCVICSIEYRLVPESSFAEQMEDVKDVETWIRHDLLAKMAEMGKELDSNKVVALGGSAGGHIALLTPKYWNCPPSAICVFSAPTDMHSLPFLNRGRLSIHNCPIPDCTPEFLASATDYNNPPNSFAIPRTREDYEHPRRYLGLRMFREGVVSELLLRGLVRGGDGKLRLPGKGSVTKQAIDGISPCHICTESYPPTCLAMGTNDEVFELSHIQKFGDRLDSFGVKCKMIIAKGEGHAFEIWAENDGKVHLKILRPAVEWIAQSVGLVRSFAA